MKKSDSYKTLEEKVGSAYENVKVNFAFNVLLAQSKDFVSENHLLIRFSLASLQKCFSHFLPRERCLLHRGPVQ